MGNLEYAIFPHARSPVFAKPFGIPTREIARDWIAGQIKTNVAEEAWAQDRGHLCADLLANGLMSFPVVYLPTQGGRMVRYLEDDKR